MNAIVRWTTFAATLALVGCGEGPPSLDGDNIATVPAKGRVMLSGGKPLTNGVIRIEPLVDGGSTNQATGEIQGDGSFELRSSPSKTGAMPGKYRVLIENTTTKLKIRGCNRAGAKFFGGIRTIFGPRGPSVPMTNVRRA